MAQILVAGTSTLGPYHAQMHNVYTIDQNSPASAMYVAGTTGYVGINTISPISQLTVMGMSPTTAGGQICIFGNSTSRQLYIGYETTDDIGVIQSIAQGSSGVPLSINVAGGNVGIGTKNPLSVLHVVAGTLGLPASAILPPVMSTANKNAIASPVAGMIVYDNTLGVISVYTGATSPTWKTVTAV